MYVDDRLFLARHALTGEDPYLAEIGSGLDHSDVSTALRGLGIRFVLIESGPGLATAKTPRGKAIARHPGLTLIDLGVVAASPREGPPDTPVILAAILAAACCVIASCRIRLIGG